MVATVDPEVQRSKSVQWDAARLAKSVKGIWRGMNERCHNPKNGSFKNYGGRGIRVCDDWRYNFEAFRDHIGPRPSRRYSVDRIDNNGNYEPGNVRWATAKQQMRNTRINRWFTVDGRHLINTDLCAELKLSREGVRQRLKRGWSVEKASTEDSLHADLGFNRPLPMSFDDRQLVALRFIDEHVNRVGFSPSLRELAVRCGIASVNGATGIVLALERRGLIMRGGRGRARVVTLTPAGHEALGSDYTTGRVDEGRRCSDCNTHLFTPDGCFACSALRRTA